MKLIPSSDITDGTNGMDFNQNLTVAILAYASVLLYSSLLCLEIHNLYRYIYLKKRFEIFPLSLFYGLSVPCTIFRIIMNIWIIDIVQYANIFVQGTPAVIKMCIAFSQILVMVELTIRVEQSQINMTEKKYKCYSLLLTFFRVTISLICIFVLTYWFISCIVENARLENTYDIILARQEHITKVFDVFGYGFMILTIILFASIGILIWRL